MQVFQDKAGMKSNLVQKEVYVKKLPTTVFLSYANVISFKNCTFIRVTVRRILQRS
jgi:hypothetical protein